MNGICVSEWAFLRGSASRIFLYLVLLFGSPSLFRMHLYATSVVALIDRANHKLVIAADCRVSRGGGPLSACKIIQEPGCTAAMAGLYEERNSGFHLREYVRVARREPGACEQKPKCLYELRERHINLHPE